MAPTRLKLHILVIIRFNSGPTFWPFVLLHVLQRLGTVYNAGAAAGRCLDTTTDPPAAPGTHPSLFFAPTDIYPDPGTGKALFIGTNRTPPSNAYWSFGLVHLKGRVRVGVMWTWYVYKVLGCEERAFLTKFATVYVVGFVEIYHIEGSHNVILWKYRPKISNNYYETWQKINLN